MARNYFSHDSNARNDEKLLRLRMRHKAAGYGVYFMILERMREETDYMCVKDYNTIAFDLREDAALIKAVVEDFGLFVFTDDGKYFYSESFLRRMSMKDGVSQKRSEAGKASAKLRAERKKAALEQEAEQQEPAPSPPPAFARPVDVDDDKFLRRFLRSENRMNIEPLMMELGLKSSDIGVIRKFANMVVAEWKATDAKHYDYTDWARHLIAHIRIKYNKSKSAGMVEQSPPTTDDYQYGGGFGGTDV